MQLVAYGAQDIYLTGNPQITFFKVVYRRHTNFSMEAILQTLNGTADFGTSVTATISRNGDLVHRMYLEHDAVLTDGADGRNLCIGAQYGSHLMKEVELEIGGQQIDKHYGHWMSVYSQLTEFNPSGANNNQPEADGASKRSTLFNSMSGNGLGVSTSEGLGGIGDNNRTGIGGAWSIVEGNVAADTATTKLFQPLYFWFCRNPGLALPLIALQYHEVKVNITFEGLDNLAAVDTDDNDLGTALDASATKTSADFKLWCDYIYLDTDERRRFAQVSHEYLIEQLQYEKKDGGNMTLHFNHPVKELIWAGPRVATLVDSTSDAIAEADVKKLGGETALSTSNTTYQLQLNGQDRFKERDTKYFTRTQVWEHHTGFGGCIATDSIAVYSFALKPEEHQPSGTCNFSRIDSAQLSEVGATTPINLYAVNYNVLRIMSGMGGLAYSN